MKPSKFFNFALPFDTYQTLRTIANKKEISIAEIIRRSISSLLKQNEYKIEANDGKNRN